MAVVRIATIISLLLLSACDPNEGSQTIADNPDGARATFLGTVDGCRLWMINQGQFYFANCRSGATSTGFTHRSGKTTHYYAASADDSE